MLVTSGRAKNLYEQPFNVKTTHAVVLIMQQASVFISYLTTHTLLYDYVLSGSAKLAPFKKGISILTEIAKERVYQLHLLSQTRFIRILLVQRNEIAL